MKKLIPEINKKTGHWFCAKCGDDTGGVSVVSKGKVYCTKCRKVKK